MTCIFLLRNMHGHLEVLTGIFVLQCVSAFETSFSSTTDPSPTDSTTTTPKSTNENIILIVSVVVTVVLVIICCCVGWVFLLRIKYRTVIQRSKVIQRWRSEGGALTVADMNAYTDLAIIKPSRDQWEIIPANLVVLENEKLGSGAFAAVYKGILKGQAPIIAVYGSLHMALEMHDSAVNDVAVKMLPPHADESNVKEFLAEIDFMKKLGFHSHVLNMVGCISDTRNPLLVAEFCAHGDLLRLLRYSKPHFEQTTEYQSRDGAVHLRRKDLISIAWQVSDAMSFLSSRNYIHRDVAARNILITSKLVAKVSDFGLCRYNDQALYTTRGGRLPIKWMAIESLRLMEYTTKSDVWSYGVLLYEIFTLGDTPYVAIQPTDMLQYLDDGNRLPQPEFSTDGMLNLTFSNFGSSYSLMQQCWTPAPESRPTFEEIRQKLTYLLDLSSDTYGYLQVTREISVAGTIDGGERM